MKALIIGLGSIARKHISAMEALGGIDIYALRSSPDSPEHDGVTSLYSLMELDDIEFDFFLISNPTAKHAETIERIAGYKKPLFIEKPLFDRVSVTNQSLVEKIEKLKIPTYVACSLRFLDCLKEIKKLVGGCRINELNIYSGSYLPDWRPDVDFRKSYSANKDLGGGVHIDLIHELDYLYWLFGDPNKTHSVFCSKSSLDIDAVDYAHYLWEYNGFCASIVLNYYRRDAKRTLEVVTSQNTFFVDLLENSIYENGRKIFSSRQKLTDTYVPQMEFFINNVIGKKKSDFNSANEAYKILRLCLKN